MTSEEMKAKFANMTVEEIEADRAAAKARHEAKMAELHAHGERMFAVQCRRNYQTEIHSVAINVLVGLLTKDALRAVRDEGYTQTPKIDVEQVVDFSLIVGTR